MILPASAEPFIVFTQYRQAFLMALAGQMRKSSQQTALAEGSLLQRAGKSLLHRSKAAFGGIHALLKAIGHGIAALTDPFGHRAPTLAEPFSGARLHFAQLAHALAELLLARDCLAFSGESTVRNGLTLSV